MKTKTLFPHVIAELQAAGLQGDVEMLSAIIRQHRIVDGKLVRDANQVFRTAEAQRVQKPQPTKKQVVARGVFKRAWEIARGFYSQAGGRVSDYFLRGLTIAWQEVKLAV